MKTFKVEILVDTFVADLSAVDNNGHVPAKAGSIVEVSDRDAAHLVSMKVAKLVTPAKP